MYSYSAVMCRWFRKNDRREGSMLDTINVRRGGKMLNLRYLSDNRGYVTTSKKKEKKQMSLIEMY